MIIVHCFKRIIKKRTYLMAASAATIGTNPLFNTPEVLFEVTKDEDPKNWVRRASRKIGHMFALKHVNTCYPSGEAGTNQAFDLVFEDAEPSLLRKIFTRSIK